MFYPPRFQAQVAMVKAVEEGKAYWVSTYYGVGTFGTSFGISQTIAYYTPQALDTPPKSLVAVATSPNLDVSFDAWGSTIPLIRGLCRIMGHVIWARGMEQGGSVAMPSTLSFMVGFAYPLDPLEYSYIEVTKIWANGIQVFGGPSDIPGLQFTFRAGSEHEQPDALVVADKGASRTPGFRGMRTILFTDFPIGIVGNTLPQVSAEFSLLKSAPLPVIPVPDILEDIAVKSGITLTATTEFTDTVAGVVIMSDVAPAAFMRDLMPTYNFMILDGNGVVLSRRDIDTLTIDATLEVADFVKTNGDLVTFTRKESSEVPNSVEVNYSDPTLAFTNGIQYAKRPIFPVRESVSDLRDSTQLPFVMDATQALALAYDRLYRAISEQLTCKFFTSNMKIEPGDVLQLNCGDMGNFVVRVQSSVLHFDKQVSNELEVATLLKKMAVTSSNVSADAGDYLTNTIIAGLKYPGGEQSPSGDVEGIWGAYLNISDKIKVSSDGFLWTIYPIFDPDAFDFIPGLIRAPADPMQTVVPSSQRVVSQLSQAGGYIGEDSGYIYFAAYASNEFQRVNKSTRATDYLDLTASTIAPSSAGAQFAIGGGYMYFCATGVHATPTPVRIYRLDLSLFSAAGLTHVDLDSDTKDYWQKGAVLVGTHLILTLGTHTGTASARVYTVSTNGWTVTGGPTFSHVETLGVPAANQGVLGRGVTDGSFAYFIPMEARYTYALCDDTGSKFSASAQKWGAKVAPTVTATGDFTWFDITTDANVHEGSKGDIYPWTDGTNMYFLTGGLRDNFSTLPRKDQYLAARQMADVTQHAGFDISTLYDPNHQDIKDYDFWNGSTDGKFQYITGGNWFDGIGAMIKIDNGGSPAAFGTSATQGAVIYKNQVGPPSNDDFANPLPIDADVEVTGTNVLASMEEPNEPVPIIFGEVGGASVWYKFTAPLTHTYTFDMVATDIPFTHLFAFYAIYTGGPDLASLSLVVQGSAGGTSTFSATAGITYYIQITGAERTTGAFKFTVET